MGVNEGLRSRLFGVYGGRGAAAIGGVDGDDGLKGVLGVPSSAVGLLGRRYLGLFNADCDVDESHRSSLLVSFWWQRGVKEQTLIAGGAM